MKATMKNIIINSFKLCKNYLKRPSFYSLQNESFDSIYVYKIIKQLPIIIEPSLMMYMVGMGMLSV